MTQPALSLQIQQPEAVLGTQLFERDRRRVLLTRRGAPAARPAKFGIPFTPGAAVCAWGVAPRYHAAPHTVVVLPHSGDQAPRELGGASADPSLTEGAYRALRALAARKLRGERVDHTLEPTALVHEAWIRMRDAHAEASKERQAEAPAPFRALAARMLRQILVDHARKRGARKRGGGGRAEGVDSLAVSSGGIDTDVLDLEIALEELAARDPRRARVVELRFFGGLSAAEAARELGVSEDTVKRDWRLARAWLNRELGRKRGPP